MVSAWQVQNPSESEVLPPEQAAAAGLNTGEAVPNGALLATDLGCDDYLWLSLMTNLGEQLWTMIGQFVKECSALFAK